MTYPNPFPPRPQHGVPVPWWRHWWPWAAIAVGLVAIITGLASGGGKTPTPTATEPTWQTATGSAPAVLTPDTWTVPTAPSGPLTTISSGTYEVGGGDGQVPPGKYRSTGPDEHDGICYSARLKHNDGELGDILDNDVSKGPAILVVKATDGYVEVSGCTFTKAG